MWVGVFLRRKLVYFYIHGKERIMPYIIMTDSHTDLPYTLVDKWDLPLALMPYSLDGETLTVTDITRR